MTGSGMETRVGLGIDAHRFAPERPLILAGLKVRDHDGLHGHSDADVVTHALMDALLGAAGLEDIGHYFPDDDPAFAGADSLDLLARVGDLVTSAGWQVVNADIVVVCEQPRIAPHREAMRARLAEALSLTSGRIGLRGTTTEGMGFTGRREGIAAQAVVLLERPRAADDLGGAGPTSAPGTDPAAQDPRPRRARTRRRGWSAPSPADPAVLP